MTPKTDSVAVLRERLAEERQHAGKGYPEVERRIAAYEAAIAALSAQGEVFGHYFRSADGHEHFTTGAKVPSYAQTNITPLYLHPAPPGADAVTEEMVERVLLALSGHCIDCRPHWAENRRDRELIRDALTEALAARTGKGDRL